MNKYCIARRNRVEATILTNTTHAKLPFDGNLATKAYLLGFRAGDLTVYRYRRCVIVSASSTHQAFVELFRNLFSKYRKVNVGPRYHTKLDSYFWALSVILDRSFHFLIDKPKDIPQWVESNSTLFFHFLAGYIDTEGSIYCFKHCNRADICLQIASTDLSLLKSIKDAASALGYDFRLTLSYHHGPRKGYGNSNKDYWCLRLYKDDKVISLLKKLPLLHEEKRSKRELALSVFGKEWHEVEHLIRNFRAKIKKETADYVYLPKKSLTRNTRDECLLESF